MIALAIVAIYFVVGVLLGRRTFVSILGTNPRRYKVRYDIDSFWTSEFTTAVWMSILATMLWPVVYPFYSIVFADTPHEQLEKKKKQQLEFEKSFKEFEHTVVEFSKRL